jgi:hypothetical protein
LVRDGKRRAAGSAARFADFAAGDDARSAAGAIGAAG